MSQARLWLASRVMGLKRGVTTNMPIAHKPELITGHHITYRTLGYDGGVATDCKSVPTG